MSLPPTGAESSYLSFKSAERSCREEGGVNRVSILLPRWGFAKFIKERDYKRQSRYSDEITSIS